MSEEHAEDVSRHWGALRENGRHLKLMLIAMGRCADKDEVVVPPLGIMSIAAFLRKRRDVVIEVLHQKNRNDTTENLARRIIAAAPDVVGIGTSTQNAWAIADLVSLIRKELPRRLIVIGGPHVSAAGVLSALEQSGADVAVPGEGECAMDLILTAWTNRSDYSTIPGIAWRDAHGRLAVNPGKVPIVEELDSLPFLAYDLIDLKQYWQMESMGFSSCRPYAALSTSRGCPYLCNWCHRIHGKTFRAQSPERIVDEIDHLVNSYQIKEIEFVDDVFNLDRGRVLDFCRILIRRNLKIAFSFPNGIRADLLNQESINALADAGMNFCSMALETGSPRLQELCGKRLNIAKMLEAVELAAARGVFTRIFAMVGHPTETAAEIEQTIRVVCESKSHMCLFFTVTPYPGSEIFRIAQERFPERLRDLARETAAYYTVHANLSEVSDEDLRRYIRIAYRRFYCSPKRLYRMVRDFPNYRLLARRGPHTLARLLRRSLWQ